MKKTIATLALVSAPLAAFAQYTISNVNDVVTTADSIINTVVWSLVSLAVLFVVWNVFQFIRHAASEDRKTYQNGIMWGIVGLAVILSIWGLVNILRSTFWVDNATGRADAQGSLDSLILKKQQ